MSSSLPTDRPDVAGSGHVSVHLDHLHPAEISFAFETQAPRLSGAMGVSVMVHGAVMALTLFLAAWLPTLEKPIDLRNADDQARIDQIVWTAAPGPGGGGGGGGNKSVEPPRLAQLPGKDKITVPTLKPVDITPKPEPPKDVEPQQTFNIPAQLMAKGETTLVGAIDGMQTSNSTTSQGSGSGGGAGTGNGTGIGPGSGSGLGPGSGGGTGGGVYRPGSGIELPRLLREVKPQYTADAMRAKIQGTAVLDCVVGVDGVVTECDVVRSLDATFGLDQEAVKAARQWRFVPGKRLGQPVPVLVTIELMFTLR
jgi:periplasmic protein TonB